MTRLRSPGLCGTLAFAAFRMSGRNLDTAGDFFTAVTGAGGLETL